MKKVLFVQGSLRKLSFNRQLQKEIVAALGDAVEIDELAYDDVAPINQDDEWPTPASVARVRADVQAADAIWIVSPQYNGSFPGHVKNLF
ncbi:MAG TPA: NADPH-dependent FMN reductase, partial [Atopobiaceae bacterium]|nr:NADPH-dependent FMN reductase [Atopobiaceae bacterium]